MSANSELNNYLKAIRNFPYHVGSYDAALPEKKCGEGDTHGQACFRDGWQSAVEAINERIMEMQGSGNAPGFTGDMEVLARLMAKDGYRLSRGTWNGPDGEQLPTVCIDRPDTPAWNGVWSVWDEAEGDNEASTAFQLYSQAEGSWEEKYGDNVHIGDANKKVDRTAADGPRCHRRLVRGGPATVSESVRGPNSRDARSASRGV